jgi:predicted RNase H-like HicB family nuclease
MTIITLNPSMRASSTSQYTLVSFKPDARTLFEQSISRPTNFLSIAGSLPGRRWLTYPIVIKIEDDDGEYVVTELKYHMHGEGSTIPEAIEAFRRIFSGYLDILSEEENNLSSYLHEQLEYLRSAIRTE